MAALDFYLFLWLQHFLNDKKFENFGNVQNVISSYFTQKPIYFFRFGIENCTQDGKML